MAWELWGLRVNCPPSQVYCHMLNGTVVEHWVLVLIREPGDFKPDALVCQRQAQIFKTSRSRDKEGVILLGCLIWRVRSTVGKFFSCDFRVPSEPEESISFAIGRTNTN